jgi:hypothetical protein
MVINNKVGESDQVAGISGLKRRDFEQKDQRMLRLAMPR